MYSLAYEVLDVMDKENFATALTAQIKISVAVVKMVEKPSIEHIILAKQWGNPAEIPEDSPSLNSRRDMYYASPIFV